MEFGKYEGVVLGVDIINFLVKKGLRMGNGYGKERVEDV